MLNRRGFITSTGALVGAAALTPSVVAQAPVADPWAREPAPETFDPWVEIVAAAIRNNVRELHRFSGCRLMAVIKNNANCIGLRQIGPILDAMDEVFGLAVVRVDEALALRAAGVHKSIVMMAHASPAEAEELVRHDVRLTLFQDDARAQIERVAAATSSPIPVHVMVDTGMNRIGMPHTRALPWLVDLAASPAVRIEGTFTMFSGARREDGTEFDLEHLRRFQTLVEQARASGIELGLLHGAPSSQIIRVPETHELDLIRPGGAIYGLAAYRQNGEGAEVMDIQPTFRRVKASASGIAGSPSGRPGWRRSRSVTPTATRGMPPGTARRWSAIGSTRSSGSSAPTTPSSRSAASGPSRWAMSPRSSDRITRTSRRSRSPPGPTWAATTGS